MNGIDFIQNFAVMLVVAALVGWVCQRLRLSVVVGYIVAGVLIGPLAPWGAIVQDMAQVQTLAQLGLIFLMFAIGLRLSLRKLRRLGFGIFLSVCAASAMTFYLSRLFGAMLGFEGMQGVFFASVIVVSSSAIVVRILLETGKTHERAGQLAMGITVIEDILAVVMLTLLSSLVAFGVEGMRTPIGATLGQFGAFVVLVGVAGLLIVPWLLRRLSVSVGEELQTLGTASLLFVLAVTTYAAGYSLALGAFFLGMIVAETPQRFQIERTFEGLRDIFTAVFFVAVGMQIDLSLLDHHLWLVLLIAAFTLVVRVVSTTTSLTLIGTPPRDALRAGLTVTPVGEFSFIIAQVGVSAAVLPADFYSMVVGVSLLTTLGASLLTRKSGPLIQWVAERQPKWLDDWGGYYRAWVDRLQARRKRNRLWQLSRKRLLQVSVSVLFVTGLMLLSERLLVVFREWLGRDFFFPGGLQVLFWIVLCLVALAPLVAIWRNVSAMALLYAQVLTHGMTRRARVVPLIEHAFKILAGGAMFLWLSNLLPSEGFARWVLAWSGGVALVALLLLRRQLIRWHSELEVELQEVLGARENPLADDRTPWLRAHSEWNFSVGDCVLPDLADCQGKPIGELALRSRFGCTVVGIERQGHMISLPAPDSILYPRDKVLLLGTAEQVDAAKRFLQTVSGTAIDLAEFDDIRMELMKLPRWSRAVGLTLFRLAPAHSHHVQIAGIHRNGTRIFTPRGEQKLEVGDEILALGTPEHLRDFKAWLHEEPSSETVDDT